MLGQFSFIERKGQSKYDIEYRVISYQWIGCGYNFTSYESNTCIGVTIFIPISKTAFYVFFFRLDDASIPVFLKILQEHSHPKGKKALSGAVILDVFKTISQLGANVVASVQKSRKISIINSIRHFLMSKMVNENYLFISCLECLDVVSWAGTTPGQPSVLEPEEFEKIMQLLDAPDQAIARKVSNLLRIAKGG